jgi:nucleotide-binding universal stress UspA family protein
MFPGVTGTTVVAFDGSEIARAALACAARRAGPEGTLLVTYVASAPTEFIGTPYYERSMERTRERAQAVLSEIEGAVPAGAQAETRVVEGPPARALVELAREVDAEEIAVGSRGFGSLRATALGSTSHALLHEADRPVLVVVRRAAERELRLASADGGDRSATVVVGYDGSDFARAALGYSARRAATTGARLLAVCAYEPPSDWLGTPYYQQALDEHQERGRQLLSELKARGGLDVALETDLLEGPPAEVLARSGQAHDAGEIVVGSRGLGRFRAALGSVSHALLHEADRPTVVVPAPAADSPS